MDENQARSRQRLGQTDSIGNIPGLGQSNQVRNRQGQSGNKCWKVRHETRTMWQKMFVSLGFKYWGKQVCMIGYITGARVTGVRDCGGADCDIKI